MIEITLNDKQKKEFQKNGFLVIENFLDTSLIDRLHNKLQNLFAGKFETGIEPDEWNWRYERDDPKNTRQICNAWKSDNIIRNTV